MIGHLGSRVSALLDAQLSVEDTERAWEHVHSCHTCRDLVEREGWVKTRLAGLSFDAAVPAPPAWLKGSLIGASLAAPPGEAYLAMSGSSEHRRRALGLAAIGGGAVGAAVMGVLVFGIAPDAPIDRRAPSSITHSEPPRHTVRGRVVESAPSRTLSHTTGKLWTISRDRTR